MSLTIFKEFAPVLAQLSDAEINHPQSDPKLQMAGERIGARHVEMIYAPFDHINPSARVVIIGMIPGRFQATNALRAARTALVQGRPIEEAAAAAKTFASFSGEPMRTNLIRMLDAIGLAKWLGLPSAAALWSERNDLVHFTSALRYPVFVDGQNWSGTPDMVKTPTLRHWLEAYTGQELRALPDAILVPLGPKVATAMQALAAQGLLDERRILVGRRIPAGPMPRELPTSWATKQQSAAQPRPTPPRFRRPRLTCRLEFALSPMPEHAISAIAHKKRYNTDASFGPDETRTARQPILPVLPVFSARLTARQETSYFCPVAKITAKSGGTKMSSRGVRMKAKDLPS